MGRERKDFYQLKKAVGEDPFAKAQMVDVEQAEAADKRRKKKAKRAQSTSEVEVEVEEGSTVPEPTDIPVETAEPSSARTAREEVINFFFTRPDFVLNFVIVC